MKGEAACARKRRYWSRVDAHCMAQRCVGRKGGPKALRVYLCEICRGFHLTSHVKPGELGVLG